MHLLKRMKHWLVRGCPKSPYPQGMHLGVSLVHEFDLSFIISFETCSIIIFFSGVICPLPFRFTDTSNKITKSVEICVHMPFSATIFILALEHLASTTFCCSY